jgi:hypothetical protein
MPERGFQTGTWIDPWVLKLEPDQKLLFIYLWTNDHCNQAGLYEMALETIAAETKLPLDKLPSLLESLTSKVQWYPDDNLVWVKNFLRRQAKSPKFLIAAVKCLKSISNNGVVKEFLEYNRSLSIPYQYSNNSISIPPISRSNTNAKAYKGRGGEDAKLAKIPPEDKEIMTSLSQLKGWQADEDDVLWLQGLRSEFPGFTLAEFKACIDYHSGRAPPKHKGIWKNRFRNWMIKKQEFERRDKAGGKPKQERVRPIKYIRGSEPVGSEDEEDMP